MPIYRGSQKVTPIRNGVVPDRVYRGDKLAWEADSRPIVTINGTTTNQSLSQFRQACIDYGTTYQTVQVLPFRLDTSQATNLYRTFYGCALLTTVPNMDTSQSTNTSQMFYGCASLTTAPSMNTSQVTNMASMFYGCASLTTVPDMNTSQVTNTGYMFNKCSSLTDGNVRLIGKHPSVTTASMIDGSGLTRLPFYDTNGNPI